MACCGPSHAQKHQDLLAEETARQQAETAQREIEEERLRKIREAEEEEAAYMRWEEDNRSVRGEDIRVGGALLPYPFPPKMPTILAKSTNGVGHEVYVGGPRPSIPVMPSAQEATSTPQDTVPMSAPGTGAGSGTGIPAETAPAAIPDAPAVTPESEAPVPNLTDAAAASVARTPVDTTTAEPTNQTSTSTGSSLEPKPVLAPAAEVDAVLAARGWTTGIFLLGCAHPSATVVASYVSFLKLDQPSDVNGGLPAVNLVNVTSSDMASPWFATLSAGLCEVPLLICNGIVYGEACQMVKVPIQTRVTERPKD